jgi:hypothetical protein
MAFKKSKPEQQALLSHMSISQRLLVLSEVNKEDASCDNQ